LGFGGSDDKSLIPSSDATIINGLKIIERFFFKLIIHKSLPLYGVILEAIKPRGLYHIYF